MYSYKQSSELSAHELADLTALVQTCKLSDGREAYLYWDIIKNKREVPGNFLCYDQDKLLAYFGFFLLDEDAVHINALVHPDVRRQGIFTELFNIACVEIKKLNIKKLIFIYSQQEAVIRWYLSERNGVILYNEYRMDRQSDEIEPLNDSSLNYRLATPADVLLLAKLDTDCFSSEYTVMLQRFKQTILEPTRRVWLAYLGDQCIGKAHAILTNSQGYIHDVCIIPSYQHKGYGTELLKHTINQLISDDECHAMYLEVTTTNESALHIYQKCGFKITSVTEYTQVVI